MRPYTAEEERVIVAMMGALEAADRLDEARSALTEAEEASAKAAQDLPDEFRGNLEYARDLALEAASRNGHGPDSKQVAAIYEGYEQAREILALVEELQSAELGSVKGPRL